jgi:hypothetical protein
VELAESSKPLWLMRTNFLCLLNLPETIKEFGTPRNYFEGKYLGERYVQEVKNARLRCTSNKLCQTLLRKLHQGKALDSMIESQSPDLKTFRSTSTTASAVGNTQKKEIARQVRVYKDRDSAEITFLSSVPVSVLETTAAGFGLLYYRDGSNRGNISFLPLEKKKQGMSTYHGMRYWKWRVLDYILDLEELEVKDFAVLLPKYAVTSTDEGSKEYTMVSKEWSPAMLDHYEYSTVGTNAKVEVDGIFTTGGEIMGRGSIGV